MFDPEQMKQAAKYVARKNCPVEYLQEDAIGTAILRMVESAPRYDSSKSSVKTYLTQCAIYGIRQFLREEFGKGCREINTFPYKEVRKVPHNEDDNHTNESVIIRHPHHVDVFVDAEALLDIDSRLKNIDAGVSNPTVAQWRDNIPEIDTLRKRSLTR